MDPAEIDHPQMVYQRRTYDRYLAISDELGGQGVGVERQRGM